MYRTPPNTVLVASPAFIVGTVTSTVIPAPGAGNRLRIVALTMRLSVGVTGNVAADAAGGTSGLPVATCGLGDGENRDSHPIIPAPGIQLADNETLIINWGASVAAGQGLAWVAYYIDTVS